MDLFAATASRDSEPLAYRMRPKTLDQYIGQNHIIGEGRLLRRMIQADQISSILFYGPPGTGKTTLARVIANTTKSRFVTMNAVLSGVKDLRTAIAEAKDARDLYSKRTILFIDEVHRWNKAQQDALLPWVENGTVILIGATTENPYFEVNSALVSRSRIFQLKSLTETDLRDIVHQALADKERGYGKYKVNFEQDALDHLVKTAMGDARSILNSLQLAVETTPETFPCPENTPIHIPLTTAEESIQKTAVLYDKEGDYHYDTLSAFIKSIRGSDPDGVLYWLAKMVKAGEDPRVIFRRLIISAAEDIGLADPAALGVVESCAAAYDRVGLPEGQFMLSQAALYLATAPKSNSTLAYFDAFKSIEMEGGREVPNHLKDANRDEKGFGHGKGYLYPHAYRDHWVAQQYLPQGLQGRIFYNPSTQGYEGTLKSDVLRRREAQLESSIAQAPPEVLTFSPKNNKKEQWLQRASRMGGKNLLILQKALFERAELRRHDRVLDLNAAGGLLLWEALRRCPEGAVFGLLNSSEEKRILEHYGSQLEEIDQPELLTVPLEKLIAELPEDMKFECIFSRNILYKEKNRKEFLDQAAELLASDGRIILGEPIPREGTRLSMLMESTELRPLLEEIEQDIYSSREAGSLTDWDQETLTEELKENWNMSHLQCHEFSEERRISPDDLDRWLAPASPYGKGLVKSLESEDVESAIDRIRQLLENRNVDWKRTFFTAVLKKKEKQ